MSLMSFGPFFIWFSSLLSPCRSLSLLSPSRHPIPLCSFSPLFLLPPCEQQVVHDDVAISTQFTLQANAHSSGCQVLGSHHVPPSSPSPLVSVPLPHRPVCTSLPPYEQLFVVEGSGAVGVVVSSLSLSSSCPALAVLVLVLLALVLASSSSSSPHGPIPILAHCCCGDGDRPVSTHSTLQARARSGGRWVLGCSLILVISVHLAF